VKLPVTAAAGETVTATALAATANSINTPFKVLPPS
jgi:hypothetical protein